VHERPAKPPAPARVRPVVVLAALIGLALLTVVIAATGLRPVAGSIARLGIGGFLLFSLYWLAVVTTLGLAWIVAAPGLPASRATTFVWGRFVREAASDLLPFSQVGGLLIGARAVVARGVPETLVFASTLVDMTTELAAQILYSLAGVAALILTRFGTPGAMPLLWAAAGGVLLLIAASGAFLALQRRGVAWIGRLASRWAPSAVTRADTLQMALDEIYGRPARMTWAVGLHVLAWAGSGVGSWMALLLMGVQVPLWAVLAAESLIYVIRSAGFMIPAAIGVQEGAYVLVGPLFGLPAPDMLALSLIKRGRDILVGAPTLIIWQWLEAGMAARAFSRRLGPGSDV
jgi:putative membrane protein